MDLSEYILPSHSVELSVSALDQNEKPTIIKLKTMIDTGYNNGFFKILAPMQHGRMYVLHDNEVITVNFFATEENTKVSYQVSCRVIEKKVVRGQQTVTLKVNSEPKKNQRRQAFRVNVFKTYSVNYNGKRVDLTTKDISSTGMRVLSPIQMNSDDVFTFEMDTNIVNEEGYKEDRPEKIFNVNCRVVDCMPQTEIRRYMLRIQFMNLSDQQNKWLIQFLYSKESEVIQYDVGMSEQREKLEHLIKATDERRMGDDKIVKRYQSIGLLNLVVIFMALMFFLFSQPEPLYALDKFFNVRRARIWNPGYFIASMGTVIVSILFGGYGLILNGTRMNRKSDRFSRALIVSIAVGLILFLVLVYFMVTQDIFNVTA